MRLPEFNPVDTLYLLCHRLRNIVAWLPILWHDEDYDFTYTLRILRFKFKRLRQHMEQHTFIAHAEDVIAELAQADVYLRNVGDEDPDDEWSMHYDQWHTGLGINRPCGAGKKVCLKSLGDSAKRSRRNWRRVWRHIEKHAEGWWD